MDIVILIFGIISATAAVTSVVVALKFRKDEESRLFIATPYIRSEQWTNAGQWVAIDVELRNHSKKKPLTVIEIFIDNLYGKRVNGDTIRSNPLQVPPLNTLCLPGECIRHTLYFVLDKRYTHGSPLSLVCRTTEKLFRTALFFEPQWHE